MVQHFARWCLLDPDAPKKILLPDKKLHDIDKFCESCWKVCPQPSKARCWPAAS